MSSQKGNEVTPGGSSFDVPSVPQKGTANPGSWEAHLSEALSCHQLPGPDIAEKPSAAVSTLAPTLDAQLHGVVLGPSSLYRFFCKNQTA